MSQWIVRLFMVLALMSSTVVKAQTCTEKQWPLWEVFKVHFIQENGRVLDASTPKQHSSTEGQSYAMFFSLVAGDQATFDRLWQWTVDNLFQGDLDNRLPAWIWGVNEKDEWGVLDTNSASDADLWFVYVLLEAGRLWGQERYTHAAYKLLAQIELKEVVDLPELGAMLLPGEDGFRQVDHWMLNASYMPIFLLRRLEAESPLSPWGEIAKNTVTLVENTSPHGYVADWSSYTTNKEDGRSGFLPFMLGKDPVGSYDAIRTYLWIGMTEKSDPYAKPLLLSLSGMLSALKEGALAPPEKVDVITGLTEGLGGFGFSAALVPYLKANNEIDLMLQQKKRAEVLLRQSLLPANIAQQQPPYYDFVLSLFGLGWADGHYEFDKQGNLLVYWGQPQCQ